MNSHNVVFIDDDTNYIDDFRLAGEDLSVNVPVVELVPSINELVNTIIDINPDAVVVDFQLRETRSDIKYDGADVLKLLEEKTYDLPKFIWKRMKLGSEGLRLIKEQFPAAIYIKVGYDIGFLRYVYFLVEKE